MRVLPIGLATIVVVSIAACPDAGERKAECSGLPDPAAAGPGDTEGWFPMTPGRRWYYRLASQSTPAPADLRIDVGAAVDLRGFAAVVLPGVDPGTGSELTTDIFASTAAGLAHLAGPTSIDRYDLPFPVVTGQTWSSECRGLDYGEDLDGDGRHETMDVRFDGAVLGLEDVVARAGTFAGSARVRLDATLTLHPSSAGNASVTATAWQESWYSRGVGAVRRVIGDEAGVREDWDLAGWSAESTGGGLVSLDRLLGPIPYAMQWPPPWHLVPRRGGAESALAFEFTWDGTAFGVLGRFLADGVASAPFFVVTQWIGNSPGLLLPGTFVYQVAPGPDRHLVAFAPGVDVRAARFTAAGVAEDLPSGVLVGQCASLAGGVAASRVGTAFLVVWPCAADLWAATVGGNGSVGAPVLLGSDGVQFVMAAGDGVAHQLVWARPSSAGSEVIGQRVGLDGVPVGAPAVLAEGAGTWSPQDVACGPTECLVVWQEGTDGRDGLYATRVADGVGLDPAGVRLAGRSVTGWIPRVVPIASGYAFLWADDDGVKLLWLSSTLEPTPAGGWVVLPNQLYGGAYPLGLAALLSATDSDAWIGYVWELDLYGVRWIW